MQSISSNRTCSSRGGSVSLEIWEGKVSWENWERCQSLSLCSLGIIRVVSGRQFITRRVTTLARSNALLARNSVVGARIVRQAKTRGPKREVSGVRRVPEIVPHSCENYFNQISLPPRPRLTPRDSLRTFHAIKKRQIF